MREQFRVRSDQMGPWRKAHAKNQTETISFAFTKQAI
jgi:hypothetical protein